MSHQLTALDATFLELEQMDEGATMHIGGVLVFDPLPDGTVPALDAVSTDIVSRLALLPRFSQRLSAQRTGGLTWPRWVDDPQFDIRNHVHHAALRKIVERTRRLKSSNAAVGIAIISYNGGVVLGLSADCDSTPDLQVLAEGVEEGFAELRALLPSR